MQFKKSLFTLLLVTAINVFAGEVVINQETGYYQLNFEDVYTTYISQDIECMVSLPANYKFLATVPGSRDFVSVGPIQNTVYMSKAVPDDIMTNLTCHVLTPEGYEKKLKFKLIGRKGAPKVLAIQFTEQTSSELNRVVEEVKSRYNDQMSNALSVQEKTMNKVIHDEVVTNLRHWMFTCVRGEVSVSYNGASAFIDGVFNSRGNTFVQFRSTIPADECSVIKLSKVKIGKKQTFDAEFVKAHPNDDGTFTYVYQIPEVYFKKQKSKYKKLKFQFIFTIWNKAVTVKTKLS
jgi:hypothetical protein